MTSTVTTYAATGTWGPAAGDPYTLVHVFADNWACRDCPRSHCNAQQHAADAAARTNGTVVPLTFTDGHPTGDLPAEQVAALDLAPFVTADRLIWTPTLTDDTVIRARPITTGALRTTGGHVLAFSSQRADTPGDVFEGAPLTLFGTLRYASLYGSPHRSGSANFQRAVGVWGRRLNFGRIVNATTAALA